MTLLKKELRQGLMPLCVWTAATAFMVAICIFMFPEMKGQMDSVSEMFAAMGGFSEAFGMDRLNFGELLGFYGVECGNILGIGGAFFAAYVGISALAREEKDRTAEFLLTHPISRTSVVVQKLVAALIQVLALNIVVLGLAVGSIAAIGEGIPWRELLLLHGAYLAMQVELCCLCFGISAFLKRGGVGIGLGIAAMLYFANIIRNISDSGEFLKYVTPYAYAEAADIITESAVDTGLLLLGLGVSVAAVAIGFFKYNRKDIAA